MQVAMPCLLSLFASKDDAMEIHGAVQWLIKAYEDYRNRVINQRMSYKAFMEENHVRLNMPIFLEEDASYNDLLQEATDRDKVKHILENRKFTEENFACDSFGEADAIKMIAKYNSIGSNIPTSVSEKISPLAEYPQEAKEALAKVFRKHKLLCPDISSEDLVALLSTGIPSCKYMIPPYTRNCDLGLVLNILVSVGALPRNWCSIICTHGMLLTAKCVGIQRKNLCATVHKFDGYKSYSLHDRQKDIEHDTILALSSVPNVLKHLKK